MAPVLVCPECSTKHPLGEIGERTAFPCTGCGRQLKVPAAAAVAAQTVPPAPPSMPPVRVEAPPAPEPEPRTRVLPVSEPTPAPVVVTPPPPAPSPAKAERDPVPPRWVRFLLWIVAIPLAFMVVFALAKALGMLTTNEISDVALAEGWGRFWPIARLIPFVALAAAGFVQGAAFGISRYRVRRWHIQTTGDPQTNGARPRPPSRTGQSSRTRA